MSEVQAGLQRRMVFASAGLAVIVGAAFAVLIVTLAQSRRQQEARTNSERLIAAANSLEQRVLDLETDARRFALTRRGIYLGPLVNASRRMKSASGKLVDLSQGDPARLQRARRLQDGAQHYAATWGALVVEAAARNPTKARTLVLSEQGEREQDRLRGQFAQFIAAEQVRSDRSRARADRSERDAIALGAAGLAGSLLLIALYAVYVSRRIVVPVRRIGSATRRFAAGNLTERVEVTGEGEIGELGRTFNSMAESIQLEQEELARQKQDLERLASLLRSVLDATIDGIVLTDLEGNIQIANRPMRRLAVDLGFRGGANVVDQLLSVADKVTERDRYVETMERLRHHPEQPSADEFELFGSVRTFIGYTAPVRGESGLIGRIWTLREVTQERELDRLKDEFIATVSHELRTPLTSLMGFLEMVRDGEAGELTDEQKRFLAIVHRSSERLQRLVGDLLFVARLDAGGLQLHLEDGVSLDDVVAEAVESASAHARSQDVALQLEREGVILVRGDRERLGQLVSNLLSNAVKFTPAGGSVTARVFREDGVGVIEVEDTGIGIPKAEQERLFERFFRASSATEQAIPGTGLGLAITRAITQAHEGRITFRSEPGEGTCFRIEIPL
jgi:signal transduction histidine kinase/CHASE3 domain sensor protein